jgi:hypothetical protein
MDKNITMSEYDVPESLRHFVIPLPENFEIKSENLEGILINYNSLFLIGITKEYILKRNFDELKALREIIQNALDENELTFGRPFVEIMKDSLGTWIIDNGRGIKLQDLLVGVSNKECWMRGYYGEGLKIAAGYFLSLNKPVYIFTNENVFRFIYYDEENPKLYVILGKTNKKFEGTSVLIRDYYPQDETLNKIVIFNNKEVYERKIDEVYVASEECNFPKPYAIYDYPNLFYVRNILVGETSKVARRRSLFSYDVWWFRLDVSRELMSYSMPNLFKEVSKIFELSEKAREKLVEKLIESGMLIVKNVDNKISIHFSPIFAIFEGHLFVYHFPKGLLNTLLKHLKIEDKKDLVVRVANEEEERKALEKGLIPFLVSEELSEEFRVIPKFKE